MRIALFTESFLPEDHPKNDRTSNTIRYLLGHLATRGHASLLFSPAGGPRRYADTPVVSLKGSSFPLYRELTLVPPHANVRAHLRSFRPDIIHVL